MTEFPEWWWPGLLIELVVFLLLVILLAWALMRWGQQQVDKLDHDIHLMDASQRAFEAEMRQRLWKERDEPADPDS